MRKKRTKKIYLGAVTVILILTFIVMLASLILSIFGVRGEQTAIVNGSLETSLVTINNIFSSEGIKYLASNIIVNFRMFEPLVLIIMSLIGVSICESSGLFEAIFRPFKKLKSGVITFLVIFVGILATILGEYSYIILFPIVGALYKIIDKNPMQGVLTLFLGVTLGYGAGLIFSYDTYLLGSLTQASARVEVDPSYKFSLLSTEYILLVSTLLLTLILTKLIESRIAPKFKKPKEKMEVRTADRKALFITSIAFVTIIMILIYMIIPGLPSSGILLDNTKEHYTAKLFSETSPFKDGVMYMFVIVMMVLGFIYGKISKNIKNSSEYNVGLSAGFENLGFMFVLMFFISQLISILDWTNIGTVLATKLVDLMSMLQFSGMFLIITFFIAVVVISILIPSTLTKWVIMSPIIVPLFMRANITPDFTQFIFQVADGVGKSITPVFAYFIVLLGFMQKYNYDNEYKVTIFGTLKLIAPTVFITALLWLLVIIIWYVSGFPLGIHGVSVL